MSRRGCCILLLMVGTGATAAPAQQGPLRLVIATGQNVTNVLPAYANGNEAIRIGDLLFLRLGRNAGTSFGDKSAVPELAKGWSRRDSVTLVFDLDSRARWHDGKPVTSRDVLFSFARARDARLTPSLAPQLKDVKAVEAQGDHRVIIRFARPYGEQLYDATYYVQILPAHLLDSLPPDSLSTSAFARAPVGSGPYRWSRLEPSQFLELASVPNFFLGKPVIEQLVWRFTTTQDARLNLLLSGEADVQEDVIPPLSNIARVTERPSLRIAHFPSMSVNYLLFNERMPTDSSKPHPLFANAELRRALTLALDRSTMAQAVAGPYAGVASSPAPRAAWYGALAPDPAPFDTAEARRILARLGWRDTDGDGVLDRNGVPLAFSIVVTNSSAMRQQLALIAQEQWKRIGARVEVVPLEFTAFLPRRISGNFDVSAESFQSDPSPWSFFDRWGCGGSRNFARYCNPVADSLLYAAHLATKDPVPAIRGWLQTIANDFPAAFMLTPDAVLAIPKRFTLVDVHGESLWRMVWVWDTTAAH